MQFIIIIIITRMSMVIIMKFVSVIVKNVETKLVGEKKTPKFVFQGMETDLNGARIPVELQTFNETISKSLMAQINNPEPVMIPFSNSNIYAGKTQYNVDSICTHPDFVFTSF